MVNDQSHKDQQANVLIRRSHGRLSTVYGVVGGDTVHVPSVLRITVECRSPYRDPSQLSEWLLTYLIPLLVERETACRGLEGLQGAVYHPLSSPSVVAGRSLFKHV